MSVAEDIALTGVWLAEGEQIEFSPEGTFKKNRGDVQSEGTFRIELDESIKSLVLDLFPKGRPQEQYTFSVALNNEGTFLTLYHPLHVEVAHYKKQEEVE